MGRHTEEVNNLIGSGFNKFEAMEMTDTSTLERLLNEDDEDEQYLREQGVEDEELDEIDGYSDEPDYDYDEDEDEESELSFEDGYRFFDEEDDANLF